MPQEESEIRHPMLQTGAKPVRQNLSVLTYQRVGLVRSADSSIRKWLIVDQCVLNHREQPILASTVATRNRYPLVSVRGKPPGAHDRWISGAAEENRY
jgi:hypothetical protein